MKGLVYDTAIADMIENEEKVTAESVAYILKNAALSDNDLMNRVDVRIIIDDNIKRVSRCLEKAENASPELVPGLAQALACLVNAL